MLRVNADNSPKSAAPLSRIGKITSGEPNCHAAVADLEIPHAYVELDAPQRDVDLEDLVE